MRPKILNGLLLTLALLFWLAMSAMLVWEYGMGDYLYLGKPAVYVESLGFRLLFAGFLLFATVFFSRFFSVIEKLKVTVMLWRLFLSGMVGITVILLVSFAFRATVDMTLHRYLVPAYLSLVILAFSMFFLVIALVFRRFILYPRTRRKVMGWNLFRGFLGLGLVFLIFQKNTVTGNFIFGSYLLYFPLMLILSANVRWINYLTFMQKLRALGLFMLILVVILVYLMAARRLPQLFGILIEDLVRLDFLYYLIFFSIIYCVFSILVLFFNLPTSSVFEKKSFEIASFDRINQAIQSNLDFSGIIGTLLDASLLATVARAGWIEMLDPETGNLEISVRNKVSLGEINQIKQGQDLTQQVLDDQKYLLVRNTRRHKTLKGNDSGFRSLLVLPIHSNKRPYGAIFIANEVANSFEDEAINSVVTYAEQAGMAFENAQLIQESIGVERYQEQLKIAQEVQTQLLPSTMPTHDKIEFAAISKNAEEVGGDYFDIAHPHENVFKVAIGDVSGKGTTAAFYMAEMKGIFHALTSLDLDTRQFIITANKALSECFQKGFFITMTYLEINLDKQEIDMVRAGHCPAFLLRNGQQVTERLDEGTVGLAIVRNSGFAGYLRESQKISICTGDLLTLYTDGIIEARNDNQEQFGYERLQEIICKNRDEAAEVIATKIENAVKSFTNEDLDDDYTVLILKFL